MRILLLAPIYALVSWCMMVFLPFSAYIEILRDIYEAYTLYCFWVMLVLWCGGQRRVIEIVDRQESMGCYLCPLVQPCGCGLPVFRFRNSTNLFRYHKRSHQFTHRHPCLTTTSAHTLTSPTFQVTRIIQLNPTVCPTQLTATTLAANQSTFLTRASATPTYTHPLLKAPTPAAHPAQHV